MKYSTDEALKEIYKRSDRLIRKRERRIRNAMSVLSVFLFAAVTGLTVTLAGAPGAGGAQSVYGAFLLSSDAGAYVLVALIAFILGIAVTLATRGYRGDHKNEES